MLCRDWTIKPQPHAVAAAAAGRRAAGAARPGPGSSDTVTVALSLMMIWGPLDSEAAAPELTDSESGRARRPSPSHEHGPRGPAGGVATGRLPLPVPVSRPRRRPSPPVRSRVTSHRRCHWHGYCQRDLKQPGASSHPRRRAGAISEPPAV